MNINLIRLKGIAKTLSGIEKQITRLADILEHDLASQGVFLPGRAPVTRGEDKEASLSYENEELAAIEEALEEEKARMRGFGKKEEVVE